MLGLRSWRTLCPQIPLTHVSRHSFHSYRPLVAFAISNRRSLSLFSRPAFPPAPVPTPQTVAEVSKLENIADTNPGLVDTQVALFDSLIKTKTETGRHMVMSRWERMCEFNPSSPLLHSDEAFRLYLSALVQSGLKSSITHAVQRRESLLAAHPPSSAPTSELASSLPPSRSKDIAQTVLSENHASAPAAATSSTANASSKGRNPFSAPLSGAAASSPIAVTLVEPRSASWIRLIRFIVLTGLTGFLFLVVFAVFLENSGLLKAGPKPPQYEPMQGKTFKFSDVHGVDEVKEELQELVQFLKDPTNFTSLGGKLPKGVLLTGSPGTGKTLLARAVAGEAGVPFFFASASEFDEMYVGVGAKRIRELFAAARAKQPAIIFIDELDAVGGKRTSRDQNYMKQTLNQLLVEMDGFLQTDGVIVIAATNFPESLDPALVRPGRFDRHIAVPLPDIRGRVQILQHFMKEVTIAEGVDTMVLARGTSGFSGADLQNMVNQAAVKASKDGSKEVTLREFEWAKDRIIMGSERKSSYIDEKVKKLTAYHEGGHALVALYTDGAMPLHKVTCVPRGHALGLTAQLPTSDRYSVSKKEYLAIIDVCMGGRVAEELIFGPDEVTSGASSDIQKATSTASDMVRRWGYSSKVGPVYYPHQNGVVGGQKRGEIDSEIQKLLEEGQDRVVALLKEKEQELHLLADALVEYETLDLEEVKKVIKGEPIRPLAERIADPEPVADPRELPQVTDVPEPEPHSLPESLSPTP